MVVNCTQSALQHLAGAQAFFLLLPFSPGIGDNGLEQSWPLGCSRAQAQTQDRRGSHEQQYSVSSPLGLKGFCLAGSCHHFLVQPVSGPSADFISDIQGVAVIPGQM